MYEVAPGTQLDGIEGNHKPQVPAPFSHHLVPLTGIHSYIVRALIVSTERNAWRGSPEPHSLVNFNFARGFLTVSWVVEIPRLSIWLPRPQVQRVEAFNI